MLRIKFLALAFCFTVMNLMISNAHAGYFEEINVEGLYYASQDPSTGIVHIEKDVTNIYGEYIYTAAAELSNSPTPYVKSQNGGLAQLTYDFYVHGTPNTNLILNVSSIYTASHFYEANVLNGFNQLSLNIGVNDSIGTHAVDYRFYSGDNQSAYFFNGYNQDNFIQPILTTVNDVGIFPTDAYVSTTILPVDGVYQINDTFLSSFLLSLGESGEANGQVSMSVFGTNIYLDPFFSIDSAYLDLNPTASLSFTPGVGNVNPLSPVPAPAAAWLFATAFPILFGIKRRKSKP